MTENPLNLAFVRREKARLPYSVFKPHASDVTFLDSVFENRPPTAFFQYPSYVKIERKCDRIRKFKRDEVETLFMSFKISDDTHIYNALVNSCKCAGFCMLESTSDNFNLQWTGYINPEDIYFLNKFQKTNHFPGSTQLGMKDLFWQNINRLRVKFPKEFTISPLSYVLPEQEEEFEKERASEGNKRQLYILKPVAASCGRGIKLVNSKQKIGP